jgi:hypothetical protein
VEKKFTSIKKSPPKEKITSIKKVLQSAPSKSAEITGFQFLYFFSKGSGEAFNRPPLKKTYYK